LRKGKSKLLGPDHHVGEVDQGKDGQYSGEIEHWLTRSKVVAGDDQSMEKAEEK
jgi:hypothetical protein